jgi:hypothetical protein
MYAFVVCKFVVCSSKLELEPYPDPFICASDPWIQICYQISDQIFVFIDWQETFFQGQ